MSALLRALEVVNGPRQEAYGPPEESFARIAAMWGAILHRAITPQEVALCMIALKVCREANKPGHDNRVDIAGYTEILDRIS